jgi:hypothetical protein
MEWSYAVDYAKQVLTEILADKVEPFPPAEHIVDVIFRELPKYGLTIVGTGVTAPRPTPPPPAI